MNIRTRLFHLSIGRDGWVYFALLPDYAATGPGSRNCPVAKWRAERVPGKPVYWVVG